MWYHSWGQVTETVVLVDGNGHIRGVYNGTLAFDITRLTEDVRTLQGSEAPCVDG